MGKCIYYDKKLNICKLHSDWSDAMPVLLPCVEGPCKDYKPFRNYDRIRNMSIDEMAEYLVDRFDDPRTYETYYICPDGEEFGEYEYNKAFEHTKQWLESEVE